MFTRKFTSECFQLGIQLYIVSKAFSQKNIHVLFFVSIFNIMVDINNGAILVLLLPNVIFMASIMYTAEHVNIL